MGSGAVPWEFFFDPILGWADLPMVLCMVFAQGFGFLGKFISAQGELEVQFMVGW